MSGADKFAVCNGIRLRYRDEGKGEALVLVHGVGSRLDSWDGVVAALGNRWRTVRMDLRGHGGSDKPAGPYTLDDFVEDIIGLLDHLKIERCHLAGFSLGGLIGQGFALSHPERLDRLVLLSAIAGRTEEEREKVKTRLEMVANGIAGDHFRASVPRWFTEEWIKANPDAIAKAEAENKQNDPKAYAASYRVLATTDLGERLHEITAPTLVATGEFDQGSNTRMSRFMADEIPNAKLHIFAGMKHSILAEVPGDVAGQIRDFLG